MRFGFSYGVWSSVVGRGFVVLWVCGWLSFSLGGIYMGLRVIGVSILFKGLKLSVCLGIRGRFEFLGY